MALNYFTGRRGLIGSLVSTTSPSGAIDKGVIPAVTLVDQAGVAVSSSVQESFFLASAVNAAGDYPNGTPSATIAGQRVYGGDYVWTALGTFGSAQLKAVIRNSAGAIVGTQNIGAAKTAADTAGGTGIGLGSNAEVYVTLTGTVSGATVVLNRLP